MGKEFIQSRINDADLVLTFNGERFDFPLLEGTGFDMTHARTVHYDLLIEFAKAKCVPLNAWTPPYQESFTNLLDDPSNRINLATLAEWLGVGHEKGDPALMPRYWQAAIELDSRTIDHCLADVQMTRKCFDKIMTAGDEVSTFSVEWEGMQFACPPITRA